MGEDRSDKMKWMYEGKNSSIDHEQYLLGKRITTMNNDEEEKGDFSMKPESSVATGNVTVLERLDYESKVREDPLFQIRKNDFQHRKELMSNPLKKKRIQNMLKDALVKDLRRSGAHQVSSDSDESSSDSSSSEDERRDYKSSSTKKRKDTPESYCKSSKKHRRSPRRDKTSDDSSEKHRSSKVSDKTKDDRRLASHHRPDGYGLMCLQGGKHVSTTAKRRRIRTPSPEKPKERYQRVNRSGFSRRLTKEELEKKRNEMMNNASWRDNQMKHNVKKFKLADAQEEERERKQKLHVQKDKYSRSRDFLHDMKLKTASSGSVEDSVRRKRHTLGHKI